MSWWTRLRHRGRLEANLDKELRFHLDQQRADLIARGCDPGDAQRRAILAFGGPEQIKEDCRDVRGTRWLEDLWHDVRFALRALRQRPGFAAVALLTLALGSGATTVMFTLINSVLLKPLPYPEPHRLVRLQEQTEKSTQFGNLWAFAYLNFVDCQRGARSLAMSAWRFVGGIVTVGSDADFFSGREISANLFTVLGVELAQGRSFLAQEDQPGAEPVAIISHRLWQRFGGSERIIGTRLVFDGRPYTVVGVTPAGFRFFNDSDLFLPIGQNTQRVMQNRQAHPGIQVVARLQPGSSLAEARSELALIGRQLAVQYPDSNEGRTFIADPLRPNVQNVQSTLWLLLGAVTLVLLIACANVASLLLARAVSRQRELAMRAALGAGRGRLVRQCLTESAVLALCGGGLGVLVAIMGFRPFVAIWPGQLPRASEIQIDWRVLLFALGVSLISGLLFGLAPALRVPIRDLEQILRAGSRSVGGDSRRLHGSFVIAEIALAAILLVSAGMLGHTLLRLSSLDPGVNSRNVLITRMALSPGTLANTGQIRGAWQNVLDRARQVPGVHSIAMVDTVPMRAGNNQLGFWHNPALPPRDQLPIALATSVTPDFLKVMGIPLRDGRFFTDQDRQGSEPVIVIDEVLAQQAFNRRNAAGERLWIPDMGPDPLTIVGVVGHVRHWGLATDDQAQVRAQFYYPFGQLPDHLLRRWSELMSVAIRTNMDPLNVLAPLRRELRGPSGDQVLYEIRTMEQLASATLARQRFLLVLFAIFAGFALLLACVGIYGVLAYVTRQRVPEIGVRMALGGSPRDIVRMVLRQSFLMILIGISMGAAGAIAAERVLIGLVDGMRPAGVLTFAVMLPALVLAALAASYIPARRASLVDPMTALRQD
jgi:predicted permease